MYIGSLSIGLKVKNAYTTLHRYNATISQVRSRNLELDAITCDNVCFCVIERLCCATHYQLKVFIVVVVIVD